MVTLSAVATIVTAATFEPCAAEMVAFDLISNSLIVAPAATVTFPPSPVMTTLSTDPDRTISWSLLLAEMVTVVTSAPSSAEIAAFEFTSNSFTFVPAATLTFWPSPATVSFELE